MTAQDAKTLPNVVVVGGGPAGLAIVRRLNAKLDLLKYNLVLVTATPYYTHLPACTRLVVQPTPDLDVSVNSVLVPYDGLVPRRCRVVLGRVVKVEEEEDMHEEVANENGNGVEGEKICGAWGGRKGVLVLDGTDERVKYDALVLTTGSKWEGPLAFPGSRDEVKVWVEEWREKFEKAEDVVIVGGGATGLGAPFYSNP
jgi:NADH dehydrogenase FAD-containing subunit